MDEELLEKAARFAELRGLTLRQPLGDGIHGIVFAAECQANRGRLAIKVHSDAAAFARECMVYRRLAELGVTEILGFNVPQFLGADKDLLVIEMTIVTRPFVLDFASAYVDDPPQFPPDVLTHWEEEKREQFGAKWQTVLRILAALRGHGIHQTDVTPANIGFR